MIKVNGYKSIHLMEEANAKTRGNHRNQNGPLLRMIDGVTLCGLSVIDAMEVQRDATCKRCIKYKEAAK